jgi:hypothetical protein
VDDGDREGDTLSDSLLLMLTENVRDPFGDKEDDNEDDRVGRRLNDDERDDEGLALAESDMLPVPCGVSDGVMERDNVSRIDGDPDPLSDWVSVMLGVCV